MLKSQKRYQSATGPAVKGQAGQNLDHNPGAGVGTRGNYFGHDEWRRFAPGLESLDDSDVIRSKILTGTTESISIHDFLT